MAGSKTKRAIQSKNGGKKKEDWYNTTDTVGLGYKLASGLIKAMDGEILVTDSSFKGITIECTIPVNTVTPRHFHSGVEVERSQKE